MALQLRPFTGKERQLSHCTPLVEMVRVKRKTYDMLIHRPGARVVWFVFCTFIRGDRVAVLTDGDGWWLADCHPSRRRILDTISGLIELSSEDQALLNAAIREQLGDNP